MPPIADHEESSYLDCPYMSVRKATARGPEFAALGALIKDERRRRGLSLTDLAERTHVSRRQIALVESGGNVSLSYLAAILRELQISEIPLGRAHVAIRPADARLLTDASQQTRDSAARLVKLLDTFAATHEEPARELAPVVSIIRDEPLPAELPAARTSRPLRITLDEQNLMEELRDAFRNSPDAEYRTPFRSKRKYTVPRGIDVAAGHGAELLEPDEEVLREIPEHYHDLGARMVLRARGNSLIGRGIVDRDLLFVKPTPTPEEDRIIVCRLNDHAFVKIFTRVHDNQAELRSANPEFGPIPIGPSDSFHCVGVVVGRSGYALQQTEEVT